MRPVYLYIFPPSSHQKTLSESIQNYWNSWMSRAVQKFSGKKNLDRTTGLTEAIIMLTVCSVSLSCPVQSRQASASPLAHALPFKCVFAVLLLNGRFCNGCSTKRCLHSSTNVSHRKWSCDCVSHYYFSVIKDESTKKSSVFTFFSL